MWDLLKTACLSKMQISYSVLVFIGHYYLFLLSSFSLFVTHLETWLVSAFNLLYVSYCFCS